MAYFEINIEKQVADFRSLNSGQRMVGDRTLLEGGFDTLKFVRGEVTISGIPEVLANWNRFTDAMKDEARVEIREAADLIESQSLTEVPFDQGDLAGSWFRDEDELDRNNEIGPTRIYLGYATEGETAAIGKDGYPYAWRQHEDPDLIHPTPGTKMHYLSDPFHDVSAHFPDDLAARLKPVVDSGGAMPGLGKGKGGPRLVKKAK